MLCPHRLIPASREKAGWFPRSRSSEQHKDASCPRQFYLSAFILPITQLVFSGVPPLPCSGEDQMLLFGGWNKTNSAPHGLQIYVCDCKFTTLCTDQLTGKTRNCSKLVGRLVSDFRVLTEKSSSAWPAVEEQNFNKKTRAVYLKFPTRQSGSEFHKILNPRRIRNYKNDPDSGWSFPAGSCFYCISRLFMNELHVTGQEQESTWNSRHFLKLLNRWWKCMATCIN